MKGEEEDRDREARAGERQVERKGRGKKGVIWLPMASKRSAAIALVTTSRT